MAMSSNTPLGTHFDDGIRTGPIYTGAVPSRLLPFNPTEVLSYSAYAAYGYGIMHSPQFTWTMIPQPAAPDNLVATTPAAQIPGAMNLTLRGDNLATRYVGGASPYVQFDWPRIVTVTVSGAVAGNCRVTIFGTDWYGVPLQHTYAINAMGTYPVVTYGTSLSALVPVTKAFYTVERVYISGLLGGGSSLSLGVGDVFGLPYLSDDAGDITSIGWGAQSDLQDNSTQLSAPLSGVATLVAGTVTITASDIKATSAVQATYNTPEGTIGVGFKAAPAAGTLILTSLQANGNTQNNDTSIVNWIAINPDGQYTASGTSTAMVGGAVTILTSQVQADSMIQLSIGTYGTASGQWRVSAIVSGQSFTVTSTANTETSTVNWVIIPKNWTRGLAQLPGGGQSTAKGVFVYAPQVTSTSALMLTYSGAALNNSGLLFAPSALIQPGVGFTIQSSADNDANIVAWTIAQNQPNQTQGTATLVAGTVTVSTPSVAAGSIIELTVNTPAAANADTYFSVTAIAANQSFTITSQNNADTSTVNWQIFPASFYLPSFISPAGCFVPGDVTSPPTSTTGDVRGLYAPSTPSNGANTLRFTSYVRGADTWINQVAAAQDEQRLNSTIPVTGVAVQPLTPQDLYGLPQFYTGNPS